MRILIAPDKLRGTYTAGEAAAALGRGWLSARDAATNSGEMPLADGGEGTAEALCAASAGSWRAAEVHDAAGRPM